MGPKGKDVGESPQCVIHCHQSQPKWHLHGAGCNCWCQLSCLANAFARIAIDVNAENRDWTAASVLDCSCTGRNVWAVERSCVVEGWQHWIVEYLSSAMWHSRGTNAVSFQNNLVVLWNASLIVSGYAGTSQRTAVFIVTALRTSKKILIGVTKLEAYRILSGKRNQKIIFESHGT